MSHSPARSYNVHLRTGRWDCGARVQERPRSAGTQAPKADSGPWEGRPWAGGGPSPGLGWSAAGLGRESDWSGDAGGGALMRSGRGLATGGGPCLSDGGGADGEAANGLNEAGGAARARSAVARAGWAGSRSGGGVAGEGLGPQSEACCRGSAVLREVERGARPFPGRPRAGSGNPRPDTTGRYRPARRPPRCATASTWCCPPGLEPPAAVRLLPACSPLPWDGWAPREALGVRSAAGWGDCWVSARLLLPLAFTRPLPTPPRPAAHPVADSSLPLTLSLPALVRLPLSPTPCCNPLGRCLVPRGGRLGRAAGGSGV